MCVLMEQNGSTALMWAAANGYAAVVEYLLKRGADTEAKDDVSSAFDAGHTQCDV